MTELFKLIFSAFLDKEGKLSKDSKRFINNFMFGFAMGILATIAAILFLVD